MEMLQKLWKPVLETVILCILVFALLVGIARSAGATVITVTMGTSENEPEFSATGSDGNSAEVIDVVETPRRPSAIDGTSYVETDRDGSWSGFFGFDSMLLNHLLYYAVLEIQAAHTTNVLPHANGVFLSRVDSGEYGYFDLMPFVLLGSNQMRMNAVPTGCPTDVWICQGGLAYSAKLTLKYERKDIPPPPPPPEEIPEPSTVSLLALGLIFLGIIFLITRSQK